MVEHEAAGRVASMVRKQREINAGAQFTSSFSYSMMLPTPRVSLLKNSLENASQTSRETCLLGDSRSH